MTPKFIHSAGYHESAKMQMAYLPALIGALIFLVIFGGFVPGFNSWRENSQILKDRREFNSTLAAKVSMLESLDPTELQSRLDLTAKALPIKSPFRQTLASISALINRHKVGIESLEFIRQSDGLGIKTSISGPYSNIRSFLESFESALPLVSIVSIDLSLRQSLANSPDRTYTADLLLNFHYQPVPKTIGKLTEQLPVISADDERSLRELQGFEFFDLQAAGALTTEGSAAKLFPD
ncbi:hypothetical protein HZB78_04715 [Candidatus Collierbacteria bacterium]|nr:hypothetical protein [Candidatus Collierbacteria bacterium]